MAKANPMDRTWASDAVPPSCRAAAAIRHPERSRL